MQKSWHNLLTAIVYTNFMLPQLFKKPKAPLVFKVTSVLCSPHQANCRCLWFFSAIWKALISILSTNCISTPQFYILVILNFNFKYYWGGLASDTRARQCGTLLAADRKDRLSQNSIQEKNIVLAAQYMVSFNRIDFMGFIPRAIYYEWAISTSWLLFKAS